MNSCQLGLPRGAYVTVTLSKADAVPARILTVRNAVFGIQTLISGTVFNGYRLLSVYAICFADGNA